VRVRKGIALGLIVGAIGIAVRPTAVGVRLEEDVGLAWLFALRGPRVPPAQVAVVSIDKASAQQLGMDVQDWPPPRTVHAAVIRSLTQHRVSAIVMDVWFDGHENAEDDDDLARAMTESGAVALVQRLDRARVSGAGVYTESLQSPIRQLQESAISLAPFPLPRESRTTLFWPFFETSAGVLPTLPAVALQVYALPGLDRFVSLLRQAGIAQLDALPRRVTSAADSQLLMRSLRRVIVGDRAGAERARVLLEGDGAGDLPSGERQVRSALLGLYCGGDAYYLNFYGPPGTIETVPFHELLKSGAAHRDLSGKVVFVGESASSYVTSTGQNDTYATVYSTPEGIDLSGTEIGATAFANLLTGRTLRPIGPWASLVVLLAFGGFVGLVARALPGMYALAFAGTLGIVGALAAQYLFTVHARLVPLAVPLLVQLPVGLFVGLLSRYLDIRKQVPIEVDPYARQQLFRGVCLATDVAGYTSLTEHLTRDELHDLLNDYHEMLRRIVTARRGLVWGRGGDSALCVWKVGIPEPRKAAALPRWLDRHRRAERAGRLIACLAAIEIRDAIDRFNLRHPAAQQLPTRIGLDVGEVGLGPVGGELQAVGNPANIASRIEGLNKLLGTKLLASAGVTRDLDAITVRHLGSFTLAGKTEAVSVVEILGPRGTASDIDGRLREGFAEGLALVEQKSWVDAAKLFSSLADAHPADGPTRFYHELCNRHVPSPSS
jgi:adenylate cyclase